MIIDNITIAMMELFYKFKYHLREEIEELDAYYFMTKLDELNRKNESAIIKANGNLSKISDVLLHCYNEIHLGYYGRNAETTQLEESDRGKYVRELFFKEKPDGEYIYLGALIPLEEEINTKLAHYLKNALLSPELLDHDYTMKAIDKKKFDSLSQEGLNKYKSFIDTNIKCYASLLTHHNKSKIKEVESKIYSAWRKNMTSACLDYRLNAYDRACEIEQGERE